MEANTSKLRAGWQSFDIGEWTYRIPVCCCETLKDVPALAYLSDRYLLFNPSALEIFVNLLVAEGREAEIDYFKCLLVADDQYAVYVKAILSFVRHGDGEPMTLEDFRSVLTYCQLFE